MSNVSPRSVLRYPGGKAQIAPFIWDIACGDRAPESFCEPFAGGAGVALELLLSGKVKRIILNDADRSVSSFWQAVVHDSERFAEQILTVPLSLDEWHRQKELYLSSETSSFDLGFSFFYLNRTNFSGIVDGRPIGGLAQTGKYKIDCRFNRKRLARCCLDIGAHERDIIVLCMDASCFIQDVALKLGNPFLFLDPPYYQQGSRLYKSGFSDDDFVCLADSLRGFSGRWVMTCDDHPRIREIFSNMSFVSHLPVRYSINKKRIQKELFFSSDLPTVLAKSAVIPMPKGMEI